MGTFILKRKLYSDDKKSDGWSTVGKIATGTAATLGATALGLRGARKGVFGPAAQNKVGGWYQKAGNRFMNSGSNALKGLGAGLYVQGGKAQMAAAAKMAPKAAPATTALTVV
jgi:hypothetical protein